MSSLRHYGPVPPSTRSWLVWGVGVLGYATAIFHRTSLAVAASAVMVIASHFGSPSIGIVAAIVLSLVLRWGAVRWGWGLPNGRDWQPKSTLGSLLQRGRKLRPDAIRLLRRPGRRSGAGSVHHENESGVDTSGD